MEREYTYYDTKYVPGAFGFQNCNAICWGNSLIQFMLGMSSMNQVLLEQEYNLLDNPFATEYIKLLKTVLPNEGDECKSDYENPSTLETMSKSVLTEMLKRAQSQGRRLKMGLSEECADEAFTAFIDLLDCDPVRFLFANSYELTVVCTGCKKQVSTIRDTSYRIQLFTSASLNTIDRFTTWIRMHPSELDVFKCDCGHIMTKSNRREQLKKLGEIVVIIFNKFYTKTNRWFPQELRFASIKGPDLVYQLVGKVDQSGNQYGGHYWSHTLRDGDWVLLDDNRIPSVGTSSPEPETFIIAYHLVKSLAV